MKRPKTIMMLFKIFGKKQYAEEFLKGEMFFNSIGYFTKLEHTERRDKYEGSDIIGNSDSTQLILKFEDEKDPIMLNKDNGLTGINFRLDFNKLKKICCLYAFTRDEYFSKNNFQMSKDMLKFGEYVVQIYDNREFLNRIRLALNKKECSYRHGLVDYIDVKNYSGKWDEFKKPLEYSHQNEFRIMFVGEDTKPEKLNIGDISDIANLMHIDKFLDGNIEIRSKGGKEIFDKFALRELLY